MGKTQDCDFLKFFFFKLAHFYRDCCHFYFILLMDIITRAPRAMRIFFFFSGPSKQKKVFYLFILYI